ncbi:MAG: hypothetical protein J5809_02950 [Selenomonadaceae bacterium]|nr:hypothetical protein [Selenomonadaceae bacterium]
MNYADWKRVYIDRTLTLKEWKNRRERGKMGTADKPQWRPKNKNNILKKDEYKKLREFAQANGIDLSGVKNFDGSPDTIREAIQTRIDLRSKFPDVADEKHKLTLGLTSHLRAEDFASTNGRVIELNENAYRDVKLLHDEYQKSVNKGWFVKGTDYRAIIHHEFGHTVADVYKIDPLKIACEITGLSRLRVIDFVKEHLSKYAGEFKNGQEIIAEVFADMTTANPDEFSLKFYDKVLEIVGGKGNEQ